MSETWVLREGFHPDADDLERTVEHHRTLGPALERMRSVRFDAASSAAQPAEVTAWIEGTR